MGYLSWVLAVVILDCQNEPLSGRKIVLLPLAASFVMTAWDLPWTRYEQTSITLGCGETEARTMECRLATSLAGFSLSTSSISYSRCISETECYPIADKSLASRDLVLCHIRSGESPGCGSLVFTRSLRGCRGQTLGHPRHSFGISPRFHLSHDASQPDCLGQSLRTSRTLLETGCSGYSERVTGSVPIMEDLADNPSRIVASAAACSAGE